MFCWFYIFSQTRYSETPCITYTLTSISIDRLCRAGPKGRAREWATLRGHPLSWLLSNNRLEEVCGTLTKGPFSSRLLLSNQEKGCTPSVVLPIALPLGPALHNLSNRMLPTMISRKYSSNLYWQRHSRFLGKSFSDSDSWNLEGHLLQITTPLVFVDANLSSWSREYRPSRCLYPNVRTAGMGWVLNRGNILIRFN